MPPLHDSELTASLDGLTIKHLDGVHEPIDTRATTSDVQPSQRLDETLAEQLSDLTHSHKEKSSAAVSTSAVETEEEPLYVEFGPEDKRDPVNFSKGKKWAITIVASSFTVLAAAAAGSYNLGFGTMIKDLNCTEYQATIGLSVYPLGFGLVPLITASFSEEFGRQPLYVVSMLGFLILQIGVGLAKNIQTVIVLRFLLGAFGSTGSTMVGGSLADIWMPHERGLAMSTFAITAIGGSGIGPFVGGWIAMNHHLDWRWIQYISAMISGLCLLAIVLVMKETRSTVLLKKLARKIRRETGDKRYRARIEDEGVDLKRLIYVSCTRPALLLISEPIVASFSLWVGFAWGIVYLLLESIGPVFTNLHGFNSGQIGLVFLTMVVGSVMGFLSNFYQDKLYLRYYSVKGVEGRLLSCLLAGLLFPVGMFIYALSCLPYVHWIVPVIGITIFMFGATIIYIAAFTYLADCYGPFASSAIAGSSLCRNIGGLIFPLFTQQLFSAITYRWANFLFGCIALVMAPIPFILYRYGPKIREKSKFSRMVVEMQAKAERAQNDRQEKQRDCPNLRV